jgi:predicted transposase/invertase (TIGR01784 family)
LHAIALANLKSVKEAIEMDKTLTLDKVFEETGLAARWEARAEARGEVRGRTEGRVEGRTEGRVEVARNALAQGASPEFVQKITGLDIQTITSFK